MILNMTHHFGVCRGGLTGIVSVEYAVIFKKLGAKKVCGVLKLGSAQKANTRLCRVGEALKLVSLPPTGPFCSFGSSEVLGTLC